MAYSGTHEPTGFGERDSGKVLIVEIECKGAAPLIRPVATGGLAWHSLEKSVAQPGDLKRIWEEVHSIINPGQALLRLTLRGVFSLEEIEYLEKIRTLPESGRFLYCDIKEVGLAPQPADDAWLEKIPDAAIREAARRIAGELGDEVVAAIRRQALVELYSALREVGP
jgi:hypothetical protein